MGADLIEITNTDRRFYRLLGPFLSRREVVKSVGDHVWDDDVKTWLVAVEGRQVRGFIAVAARGNRTVVESLYTVPGCEDLVSVLVAAAVATFGNRDLHTVVKHDMTRAFRDCGFKVVERTKNFTKLARRA